MPAFAALPSPVGAAAGVAGHVAGAVAGGVAGGLAGHVIGGAADAGLAAVFSAAGDWVASGAVWLLGQVGHVMSTSTTVDLSSGWFRAHEAVMATVAAAVVLPMVCCAILQALLRQSASVLLRSLLVQLPLALLLSGIAVELVQMALAVTDTLSAQVLASAGTDATHILSPVSTFLVGFGSVAPAIPAFVLFIGGLLVAMAALALWLELVVRAAAVSVAVLFLPLALATLVWPAVSHWCRRLVETLAALILSKLVIAAVLALAAGALAGGLGVGASGGDGGGFAAVVTGVALLVVATMSPFTLLRLIPAVEAGAVAHLETARHRLTSTARAPLQARNLALDIASAIAPPGAATAGAAAVSGGATAATAAAGATAVSGGGDVAALEVGSEAPVVPPLTGSRPSRWPTEDGDASVPGAGVDGSGVHGSGVHGSGVDGSGVHGSGVDGSGVHGSGVDGSGVDGAVGRDAARSTVRTGEGSVGGSVGPSTGGSTAAGTTGS